jgi:predicted site-specific integrase-resolvase
MGTTGDVLMLSLTDICERFGVNRVTVATWMEAGQLVAIDVSPVGSKRRMLRFSEESIRDFERQRSTSKTVNFRAKMANVRSFLK